MEQKHFDWALRLAWLCVVVSTILVCTYIVVNKVNSCTSDPLDFIIEQIKSQLDVSIVSGSITVINNKGASQTFYFGDGAEERNSNILNINFSKN